MSSAGDPHVTPVDHALDQLGVAVDHLVKLLADGGLAGCDPLLLVQVMQDFERVRNRLAVVDHHLIRHGEAENLSHLLAQGSMPRVLVAALGLSLVEAHRRVKAAAAVGPRATLQGEPLPPVRPVLAAAQAGGTVSPDQVGIIATALEKVDRRGFDPAQITTAEQVLTDFAAQHGSKDLKGLADRVIDAIDPDGTLPDDQLNHERRDLRLYKTRDGAYTGQFRLTGTLGAKLTALLHPLARPRISVGDDEPMIDPDTRHHGQRMHDALEDLCDRLLRAGDLPASGGTPTTLIVTIPASDLQARTGHGTTSDGTTLSAHQVRTLADAADVFPTLVTGKNVVLAMHRTRRIATSTQTLALIARDGGCSFPGCAHPPGYCERHHVVDWLAGGLTNVDNLTLLCRYHHHNFLDRGWTCTINLDGLPEWRPPRWLDRGQSPLINSRILARLQTVRHARGAATVPSSGPG